MEKITGVIRQEVVCCGSKSDGTHVFLEVPNSGTIYKIYRKDVYSVNDDYFDQFKDRLVLVIGEIEQEQWIRVEQIDMININNK